MYLSHIGHILPQVEAPVPDFVDAVLGVEGAGGLLGAEAPQAELDVPGQGAVHARLQLHAGPCEQRDLSVAHAVGAACVETSGNRFKLSTTVWSPQKQPLIAN